MPARGRKNFGWLLEVLYGGGLAGGTQIYQVNFRGPENVGSGTVNLQLSASWIAGQPVQIVVR